MKLLVYVLGREVAVLESVGDFKSVLTYAPHAATDSATATAIGAIPRIRRFWSMFMALFPLVSLIP